VLPSSLADVENLLYQPSRSPGVPDQVVLVLAAGGRRYADRELLRSLLAEAKEKEDGFWTHTLENALAFLA
jgi:nickel-dependent lactate racemase